MDFHAQIVSQEWWSGFGFWLLVAGLIGEALVAALARPLGFEGRTETVAMLVLTAVVAVGCAFEHVADGKVGALIAQEETASGDTIARLGAAEQNDRKIANQAAAHAADLGVKVDQLPSFVKAQESKINGQIVDFQKFSGTVRAQTQDAINRFQTDTAALDKARTDAQAAAAGAEAQFKAMAAANAPRGLSVQQQTHFVASLSKYEGSTINVFLIHAPSADAAPLAQLLESLLEKSRWKATGVFNLLGGVAGTGILCVEREKPSDKDDAAVKALRRELQQVGIPCGLKPGVTDTPTQTLGATVGPNFPASPANLWLIVGSKP